MYEVEQHNVEAENDQYLFCSTLKHNQIKCIINNTCKLPVKNLYRKCIII